MTAEQSMEALLKLDPEASVRFSTYTGKWFVHVRAEIGNGTFLRGVGPHRDDPASAVVATHHALVLGLKPGEVVVTHHAGGADYVRQHWLWAGTDWMEIPVEEYRRSAA